MENKNHNESKIKKKIKECKKRLKNLKLQGFTFSKRIYDDIDELEKKTMQPTLLDQVLNKKLPMTVGIVGILFIAIFLGILFPNLFGIIIEEKPLKLTVDNLVNGTLISESITITGFAEQQNRKISLVQIKIDDNEWKEANGTNPWEYPLSIDTLKNGNHFIQIRCYNGEEYKTIKRTIFIDKKDQGPKITIQNPGNNEVISGIIQIMGTATTTNDIIQQVEIKINEGKWINATLENDTFWHYMWNTTNLSDGTFTISARSRDTGNYSDIHLIEVNINNKRFENNSESNLEYIMPEGGLFDLYIINTLESMEPGETYIIEGKHRRQIKPGFSYFNTIETILTINRKPDWLNVTLPNEPIVTPPDGKIHSFKIYVSISDEAPTNKITHFTIAYTYGISPSMDLFYDRPFFEKWLLGKGNYDIEISTGKW